MAGVALYAVERKWIAPSNDQSLTPGDCPRLGPTRFDDWLRHNVK
jgi:hypothetical protein